MEAEGVAQELHLRAALLSRLRPNRREIDVRWQGERCWEGKIEGKGYGN
jgi:hypothetical protein